MDPSQVTIVTAEPRGREVAAEYGVAFDETALTRDNYRAMLDPRIGGGDFLLNLSVDVSSTALIELCRKKAPFISIPVSSRGPAVIPIRACRPRRARIMRCARARWRCAGGCLAVRPPW